MSGISLGGMTVFLGADTAGFQTDMGRAARVAQQQSAAIKKSLSAIGTTIAGLAGGLTVGAFGAFVKDALIAQDKADELGQKIGLTATQISKLSVQAKFSATDLDGVAKSMVKLAQNQAAASAGSRAQAAAFEAIGVSVKNADGSLKSGDVMLGQIADKMATYRDGAEKTALAIALFGKTGTDMIPMLNEGAAALDDWGKMAEQFGLTISVATGKAAAELGDNVDKMMLAGRGVANTIAAELAPALAQLTREAVAFLRSDQWKAWLQTIRDGAKFVADNLDKITGAIRLVGEVAVTLIAGKVVTSLALATFNVLALAAATVKAVVGAGSLGAAWTAAGGNILATTAASVKAIGGIPLALGAVTAAFAGWQIGKYFHENFLEARLAGIALVEGLLVGWERIKQGADLLWAAMKFGFGIVTDQVKIGVAAIVNAYAGALEKLPNSFGEGLAKDLRAYADSITPATNAAARFKMEMIGINAESTNAIEKIRANTGALAESEIAAQAAADAKKKAADATNAHGAAALASAPNVKDGAAADALAEKNAKEYAAAEEKLAELLAKLKGSMGEAAAARAEYEESVRKATDAVETMIRTGKAEADVHRDVVMAQELATQARDRALAAIEKQRDVLGAYLEEIAKDRALIGLTERQKAIAQAVQAATDKWNANRDAQRGNAQTLKDLTAAVAASEGALYDQAKAAEAATAHAQRYGDIVRGAFDSMIDATAEWAVGGFKNSKDFWKGMVDTAKRAIAQLLAEWAKTKIIGWFTGSGGGGGGFWSTLIAGAASLFGGGSSSSGGSGGGAVTQATGGFLQNYATGAAQSAATGGSAASGAGSSGMGVIGNTAWGYFGQFANSAAGSATAAAAPWLGALAGGMYGATRGDGGIGTAVGVTAGVIAGYYAGTVAASAIAYSATAYAATTAAGAGAATVGAATAGGAAAGASAGIAAIPVIGWVAAIVLAIDAISGGKALGTKYRPASLQTDVSFGAEGPGATANLTEWKYRRNIFQWNPGGSLQAMRRFGERDYRGREIPIDPELMAALQKVADDIKKTGERAAEFLTTEAVAALDASFQTLQIFDKKGRLKRTETIGTILGKEYKESWEKFQVRMHAETIIATIGQLDAMASSIAEAYRKDAETLLAAAAVMMQAQRDITDGKQLLGTGRGLESTMAWLEKQRAGDETLAQTYQRLAQATAQYRELLTRTDDAMRQLGNDGGPVAQMRDALYQIQQAYKSNVEALNAAAVAAGLTGAAEKDLAKLRELNAAQINKISGAFFAQIDAQIAELTRINTPAGNFAATMRGIHASMLENIQIANMVARAAGYQGASEQQLSRIHVLAARQAAAAIATLQGLARQQARSLGYLGPQTVAEIDARLAELQGRADAAAQAVEGFGGAMQSVAQDATNAINLLLGALSPLNDQQKLQVAMQGLYAGTATQEQVLDIGRRLYASSQAYTDLFWQVMGVRPRNAGAGSGGGRSDTANQPKPLTATEEAEMRALREQRAIQVQRERYTEANELANTIAAQAAASGLSFQEVAAAIGFDLDKLAKDLGMSQDDLLKFLSNIDVNQTVVTDSFTSNTDRIIARMDLYWGGPDDDTPPASSGGDPGRGVTLPVEEINREARAGREEASRNNRDVIALLQRIADQNDRIAANGRQLVDVTLEGNQLPDRNTRFGNNGPIR